MPLSQALQRLVDSRLLTPLKPRPLPRAAPPQFRMDLCFSYHQSQEHDIYQCTALRHAIQDVIDQESISVEQLGASADPMKLVMIVWFPLYLTLISIAMLRMMTHI